MKSRGYIREHSNQECPNIVLSLAEEVPEFSVHNSSISPVSNFPNHTIKPKQNNMNVNVFDTMSNISDEII